MSGEFREARGTYFWESLENAADGERGRHPVSAALQDLYKALADLEKDCAWCEAYDSSEARPAVGLVRSIRAITGAVRNLEALEHTYSAILNAGAKGEHR